MKTEQEKLKIIMGIHRLNLPISKTEILIKLIEGIIGEPLITPKVGEIWGTDGKHFFFTILQTYKGNYFFGGLDNEPALPFANGPYSYRELQGYLVNGGYRKIGKVVTEFDR